MKNINRSVIDYLNEIGFGIINFKNNNALHLIERIPRHLCRGYKIRLDIFF